MSIVLKKLSSRSNFLLLLVTFVAIVAGVAGIQNKRTSPKRPKAQSIAFKGPIQINGDNYYQNRLGYAQFTPMIARATVLNASSYSTQIDYIRQIKKADSSVELRVGFRNFADMQSLIGQAQADELKSLGVTAITYNPESEPESSQLLTERGDANPAVQFVKLAHDYGFKAVLVPFGWILNQNRIPEDILTDIYAAGLDGLAIQEQNPISNNCVSDRVQRVSEIVAQHQEIAGRVIEITIQIMPTQCAKGDSIMQSCGEGPTQYTYQHCDLYIDELDKKGLENIMTIWATAAAGDQSDFIRVFRTGGASVTMTPSPTELPVPTLPGGTGFTCILVIGYSQVGRVSDGWYRVDNYGIERILTDDKWELLWDNGHGVDVWRSPDATGWSKWVNSGPESPCVTNSKTPDWVLLSVSGPHGSDETAWANDIEAAIATIRSKIPSAKQFILQAVVGGPNHQTCYIKGKEVRASWQHKHIDNAISVVVARNLGVSAGFSPEVKTCANYEDTLGHLTQPGAVAAGQTIGNYYLDFDSNITPTPTTSTPTPTSTLTATPTAPTPTPQVPGDGSGDGIVNGQDFAIWLSHFGQSISGANNGDYDGNEKIEIGDYQVWINNYTE